MTLLIIAEAPELEFSVLGTNTITSSDDEGLVFYDEVSKVQVLPDERKFTIQVITPDLEIQMDFPDAESVHEALKLFELKKVAEVHPQAPGSVRLMPVELSSGNSGVVEPVDAAPSTWPELETATINPDSEILPEQVPARPDQRPSENLPDTQKQ
ncbi:MAG: hypothetical protein WBZ19_30645 [Chthoniobacterales bacterium]